MPSRAQKIQTNFNAGILSPYMEGRPDVAQYFNGVLTGRNVNLLPEGGWENAVGTKQIRSTKDNGRALLIPFQPKESTEYRLEFGVGYIRVLGADGNLITAASGPDTVINGSFTTDLTSWTTAVVGSTAIAVLTGTARISQTANNNNVSSGTLTQVIATTVGRNYRLMITCVEKGSSTTPVFVLADLVDGITLLPLAGLTTGSWPLASGQTLTIEFTAPSTSVAIRLSATRAKANNGFTLARFDSVQLYDITGGQILEVATPYTDANLDEIRGGQGLRRVNDVLFIVCSGVRPMELVYGGVQTWTLRESPFDPMPSYEAPTDISGGTITLTPSATTGESINFTASAACFLNGDVGRVIQYGASRALITSFTSTTVVVADILAAFPNTSAIPAGDWLLEGSPGGATLDVPNKKPVGRVMTATASVATFRAADVGKFIKTYGGLLEITQFNTSTSIKVKIKAELTDSDNQNPAAAPAGSWTLEVPSWSDERGWPILNEFFQGRYVLASTISQPTTIWMSQTNNFYNFAVGALATDAVEYTHRSGIHDRTRWIIENGGALYYGDPFAEHSLKGPGVDQSIGGDTVPMNRPESYNGSALMRPIHVGNSLLFLNWSQKKVLASAYNFDRDAQIAKQSTFLTRDLTVDVPATVTGGLTTHGPVYVQEPIPLIYWLRNDGNMLVHSYNDDPEGGNNGWTTLEFDGEVESYCVTRRGTRQILTLIVKRTINGNTVRYIEEMDREAHSLAESAWRELQTQCATIVTKSDSSAQTVFTGLGYLEGKTVEVLQYRTGQATWQVPRFMGTFTVSGGQITLSETIDYACKLEIGLSLVPFAKTMRAAIAENQSDGHLRKWTKCMLRVQKSSLPVVNGTDMQEARGVDNFDQGPYLRSGDYFCDTGDTPEAGPKKWDYSLEGYVEITRNVPYPLRVLMLAGEILFSESMAQATDNEGQIHAP